MQIAARTPRKDWTVLYYLNGNNDLEPHLVKNLMDVEKVGSSDRVTIAAQLSRAPQKLVHGPGSRKKTRLDGDWTGMRRYVVNAHSSRTRLGSVPVHLQEHSPNHGEAATLRDFLRWGMENFPARHYMVVVGDHGKGFEGTGFDYLHKDVLDLKEFRQALEESGLKPDVLVMDACEMGAVEVAYQLRDSARYLVASEEIIGTQGLPHREFLQHLSAQPELKPEALARELVQISSEDSFDDVERGKDPAAEQLAAIRLGQMEPLANRLAELGKALASSSWSRTRLKELIEETQHFNLVSSQKPDSDYRDIAHFCQLLQAECPDAAVVLKAGAVEKALRAAVLENHCSGQELTDGNGLSVYLPAGKIPQASKAVKAPNGKEAFARSSLSYRELEFDRATGWSKWLDRRFGRSR